MYYTYKDDLNVKVSIDEYQQRYEREEGKYNQVLAYNENYLPFLTKQLYRPGKQVKESKKEWKIDLDI